MTDLGLGVYNVVMFAHNEADNIAETLRHAIKQTDNNLRSFYIIANGCTDSTEEIVEDLIRQADDPRLKLESLSVGDKCNAWNHYVHDLADSVGCHFCIDADVLFSDQCFPKLSQTLTDSRNSGSKTNVVAGMPLSGRNRDFYEGLVRERSCFFGNLYGMSDEYIRLLRATPFRLPIGLNWIDSFLTKAANTDLRFSKDNLPGRVVFREEVGFYTQSLSPFKWKDIQLYKNRIARYELGKLQEFHLDEIPARDWPSNMDHINRSIINNFRDESSQLSWPKRWLASQRLKKLLAKS